MKSFKFKFDFLLRVKEEAEKKIKEEYGIELQKKTTLQLENERLQKDLINYENRYLQSKKIGDLLNFSEIIISDSYLKAINLRILDNNKEIEEIDINLIKLKGKLIEAMKERKIFDKLKNKKESAYNKKMKKITEKRLEEITILHFKNKKD